MVLTYTPYRSCEPILKCLLSVSRATSMLGRSSTWLALACVEAVGLIALLWHAGLNLHEVMTHDNHVCIAGLTLHETESCRSQLWLAGLSLETTAFDTLVHWPQHAQML